MCEYDAITVDTNIFESQQFNFDEGILQSLKQFSRFKSFDFVVSEIVFNEIEQHLLGSIKSAHLAYCKALGDYVFYGLEKTKTKQDIKELKKKDLLPFVRAKLSNFKSETALKIISCDNIEMSSLMEMYFNTQAPFENNQNKKNEFPDAVALISIENWAKENNKKVLVVSKDNGWKNFCTSSEKLTYIDSLDKALSIANKSNKIIQDKIKEILLDDKKSEGFWQQLEDEISGFVPLFDLYIEADTNSGFIWEDDFSSIEYKDFEYLEDGEGNLEYYIVELDKANKEVFISFAVIYELEAFAEFSFYIHDEREKILMGETSKNKIIYVTKNIVVKAAYDENAETLDFIEASVDSFDVKAYFDYILPDYDKDEDNYANV